jgi:hypothetical protein
MQDGAGAEAGSIQTLLTLLADGEEQARQLGEMVADDPWSRAEHYRGAARRLQCTLGKAAAVARAIEAAAPGSSRGTDRSDSPRSADESSGRTTVATEVQELQSMSKRRCVARSLFFKLKKHCVPVRTCRAPNEVPNFGTGKGLAGACMRVGSNGIKIRNYKYSYANSSETYLVEALQSIETLHSSRYGHVLCSCKYASSESTQFKLVYKNSGTIERMRRFLKKGSLQCKLLLK